MCGICALVNYRDDLTEKINILKDMGELLKHRGQDDQGYYISKHCLMSHNRLSIIDLNQGHQPKTYRYNNIDYTICFNGELYNMNELKEELMNKGYYFYSESDSEVILVSFIEWKEECVKHFEGIFAFIINADDYVFIARDHLGVKPLFYALKDETLVISSEIKSILKYLGYCIIDRNGIKQLIGLGPSLVPGQTIYKDIYMLRAAHYMTYNGHLEINRYWMVKDQPHNDSIDESIKKIRELIEESIQHQLLADVEVASMLSGGIDSSIICAIASKYQSLSTYSVNYEDQAAYFKAYDYQKTMDDDYILDMIDLYDLNHKEIILSQEELISSLKDALICRDMPGMVDIDSSLLLFSKEIAKKHKVCLSGECADEILGGYPWYYKKELLNLDVFPWLRSIDYKLSLFNDYIQSLNIKDYIKEKYQESLNELETDNQHKQLLYLNIEWFMQTLLLRSDSQCMYSSLEVRVPFAYYKLVDYIYNMPKDYLLYLNEEKGLLREAFKDVLPLSIVHRKKNPYPKTHHPHYRDSICELLRESLNDSNNILFEFMDYNQLYELIETKGEMIKEPVFGQLMMGPQFLAYLYQIYLWGKLYHVEIQKN